MQLLKEFRQRRISWGFGGTFPQTTAAASGKDPSGIRRGPVGGSRDKRTLLSWGPRHLSEGLGWASGALTDGSLGSVGKGTLGDSGPWLLLASLLEPQVQVRLLNPSGP